MTRVTCSLLGALGLLLAGQALAAPLQVAAGGQALCTIVTDMQATSAEQHAAAELASFLKQVTGAEFRVRRSTVVPQGPAILVGPGRLATQAFPGVALDNLKPDGIVLESRGDKLLLAGDRPRGTLYAVYTFLEDVVGCRWWSAKVSSIPRQPNLTVPEQHVRYVPPLEYREPFWTDAFDGDWAARNKYNGMRAQLDETRGGQITYGSMFVHTFQPLVPPEKYFATHPEWFSEVGGVRQDGYAQLCVTNPQLKQFITDQVLAYLRANPKVNIVSVSQNDCDRHCLCKPCKQLEDEEGSPAGPLLHLVNYVATAVAKEFPNVAIDTLAYQYTRKPPLHVKPLPNVIIRLCSIECDFARPLTAPSNQKFADDIRGWSKISNRLYIWDYTTNFAHYILPHPNLRVLAPNVRFFVDNGVKGVFEQGAYTSLGAEMAELKAWVLAKALWNPTLDGDKLVAEFVQGYYGPAAPQISQYLKLMHDEAEATNTYLTCFSSTTAAFLNLKTLAQAEKLFNQAEAAAQGDKAVLQRVQVARLPLRYAWTMRWYELQDVAAEANLAWPGPADYTANAQTFLDVAQAFGVTMVSEGAPLRSFERRTIALSRVKAPPPPGCENLPRDQWMDLQDANFSLYREGDLATTEKDELASDQTSGRIVGSTNEWAIQYHLGGKPLKTDATYSIYASIRVDKTGNEGGAFTTGAYDSKNSLYLANLAVGCAEVPDDGKYHTYKLGTTKLHHDVFLWAAPAKNGANVKYLWVDRFWLIKEK